MVYFSKGLLKSLYVIKADAKKVNIITRKKNHITPNECAWYFLRLQ
jgi:hypothetical protein